MLQQSLQGLTQAWAAKAPHMTWAPGGQSCVGCRSRGNSDGITHNRRSRDSRSSVPVHSLPHGIHMSLNTSRLRLLPRCGSTWRSTWRSMVATLWSMVAGHKLVAEYRDKVQTTPFLRTQSTQSQRCSKPGSSRILDTQFPPSFRWQLRGEKKVSKYTSSYFLCDFRI